MRISLDGTTRGSQLDDLHEQMSELKLNSAVPKDVCTGFDTARNLFLYSWLVYRSETVAEILQAYATLELALGKAIGSGGKRTYPKSIAATQVRRPEGMAEG